jgi:hypothetical protein
MKKQEAILAIVAIVIAYFLFKDIQNMLKNGLAKIGIGSSTSEDKVDTLIDKEKKHTQEAFSPLYWDKVPKGKKSVLIKMEQAKKYCDQISHAIGYIYDNEEEIVAVFKQLKYKTQVSWLCKVWSDTNKSDLFNYLNDKLDRPKQREAWLEIVSYVDKLPTGFLKQTK